MGYNCYRNQIYQFDVKDNFKQDRQKDKFSFWIILSVPFEYITVDR